MRIGSVLGLVIASLLAIGCGKRASDTGGKPSVAVSIFPIYDLARRVAGDRVNVMIVLPPGKSEHSYDPGPQEVVKLASAKVAFVVGLGMDTWVEPVMRDAKIVRLGEQVPTIPIDVEPIGEGEEDHHDDHGHAKGAPDEDHDDHAPAKGSAKPAHDDDHDDHDGHAKEAAKPAHDDDHAKAATGSAKPAHDDHAKGSAKAHDDHDDHDAKGSAKPAHDDDHAKAGPKHDDDHAKGSAADDHAAAKPHDDHGHAEVGAPDPHFWMDPERMIAAVDVIAAELALLDPAGAETFAKNAAAVKASLKALDTSLQARSKAWTKRTIVTFHGSMTYFAKRYGLRIAAVVEPVAGTEPTAAYIIEVLAAIKRGKAAAIFSEPQLDRAPGETISRESKIPLGELDPVGGLAGRDTYETLLTWNADQLDKVLK